MDVLSFQEKLDESEGELELPERQRDWYEFRKNRNVYWRPRRSELQYIGSIRYSFDRRCDAVGSFCPDNHSDMRFPKIVGIDQSIVSALSERRIVWTPNYQAEGNIDRTEWKAFYLKVCRRDFSRSPIQIQYDLANDATFDVLDVTARAQRIRLYVAKSLRDLYHSTPFACPTPKNRPHKVLGSKKTAWHKGAKHCRSSKKFRDVVKVKQIMTAIENRILTQEELNAYINGNICRDDVVSLIRSREDS